MITIETILSDNNLNEVISKYDSDDKKEIIEYLEMNKNHLYLEIKNGDYSPSVVNMTIITTSKGKRRTIASFNIADKLILKLLANALKHEYKPLFHDSSFAFQDDKGIQDAVELARVHIESGFEYTISVDFKDYFEHIDLKILLSMLKNNIHDEKLLDLIKDFLFLKVNIDGEIVDKKIGLLQGAPTIPVLSNIYLHCLDDYLNKRKYNCIRFADDIRIFTDD